MFNFLKSNYSNPSKEESNSEQPLTTGGKKVYTEGDLAAAISEIKNGKLGTRRAASLYGIPRSTLRNKVPRMDIDESSSGSHNVDDEDTSNETSSPSQKELPFQSVNDRMLQVSDCVSVYKSFCFTSRCQNFRLIHVNPLPDKKL